jgi:tartrate dehydrogenase/decarboxylase/D-malate dehydrogenase
MLLDHLGYPLAGAAIVSAIERCLQEGPRTPDVGGKANTQDMGKAIASAI